VHYCSVCIHTMTDVCTHFQSLEVSGSHSSSFFTLLPSSFSLPLIPTYSLLSESVETPSSGGGPPTREWVLVGVAGKSQLGSNHRIKEKMANMCRVIQEFEDNRRALQDAQQALNRRVQDAEERAQNLQIQFGDSRDAYQELLQTSQAESRALQARLEASENAYQESQLSLQASHTGKRDLQLQLEALHDAYLESQQFLRQSQQFRQTSQAEKENLQAQTEALQRRVKDAEHRAEVAERRAHDARQGASEGEPSWVVQRDDIHLTDRP